METITSYSPPQNGIAKHLNRTLLEMVHAIIFDQHLLKMLWPEVVKHACYIKNRVPTCALGPNTTPYQALYENHQN
jgi:hypothetical protein